MSILGNSAAFRPCRFEGSLERGIEEPVGEVFNSLVLSEPRAELSEEVEVAQHNTTKVKVSDSRESILLAVLKAEADMKKAVSFRSRVEWLDYVWSSLEPVQGSYYETWPWE